MHPDKQRIKIAEICGADEPLPDYLNDEDAMCEAEELIEGEDYYIFRHHLKEIKSYSLIPSLHARAEAFLKTFGEWEEDDNSN